MTPEHRPDRRSLMRAGLLAGTGAALAGCGEGPGARRRNSSGAASGSRSGGQRVRWRLASSFPSSLIAMYGAAERLAERVFQMSDGMFEIEVYQAGEIVKSLEVLDAVEQRTVEAGQTAGYYYTGKNPALAFETCVPFGLSPRQQQAWLRCGGGLEATRELYADFGVRNFPGGNTGAQMGGWFKRPVAGPEDLKGLKMRIPGLGGRVMDRLGVSVQVLPGGEIFQALERGAIDATEWVGPFDDERLGFHKAARHYQYPGWWEPGPELTFIANERAWSELPADYRAMFETAVEEAAHFMQTTYDSENPAALERLRADGVSITRFDDSLMRAAREASEQMLDDDAGSDAGYAKLLSDWREFRRQSFEWFATAELAYAGFAFRATN